MLNLSRTKVKVKVSQFRKSDKLQRLFEDKLTSFACTQIVGVHHTVPGHVLAVVNVHAVGTSKTTYSKSAFRKWNTRDLLTRRKGEQRRSVIVILFNAVCDNESILSVEAVLRKSGKSLNVIAVAKWHKTKAILSTGFPTSGHWNGWVPSQLDQFVALCKELEWQFKT